MVDVFLDLVYRNLTRIFDRYGWRYQIGPWVRAGYRVIAPDMLGYGSTDKPDNPEEYNYSKLSQDLAALLDAVGVQKAVRTRSR